MYIGVPETSVEGGLLKWSVPVRVPADAPDRLWFTVPIAHAGLVTERTDPAVIGLLVPAMHSADVLRVGGPVSDELAHSITHGYQHVLEAVIPRIRRVPLEIGNPVATTVLAPGVGTAFSGGIDSFAVLAEHHFRPVPNDLRLTHMTLFNVGAMRSGEAGRRRFHRVHAMLSPAADRMGLPFIPVDSNLDDFYSSSTFLQTHGPRNLSAASLLQGGVGRFYFAGGYPFAASSVRRAPSTAFSDPIAIPLLTTRGFRPTPHGSQYTRVEKTLIVAEISESRESLHVCTSLTADGRNCSSCNKCLRTELTLEIAGRLDEYHRTFDLATYRTARRAYLDEVVSARDAYSAEIRAFARRSGFGLPSTMAGFFRHNLRRAVRRAGTIRRRIARRRRPG